MAADLQNAIHKLVYIYLLADSNGSSVITIDVPSTMAACRCSESSVHGAVRAMKDAGILLVVGRARKPKNSGRGAAKLKYKLKVPSGKTPNLNSVNEAEQ